MTPKYWINTGLGIIVAGVMVYGWYNRPMLDGKTRAEMANGTASPAPEDSSLYQPSKIKLADGKVLTDVGYNAKLVTELNTKNGEHIALIRTYPCYECDATAELLFIETRSGKKFNMGYPGTYKSKDPESTFKGITEYLHVFYGHCTDDSFEFWAIDKQIDDSSGEWKFSQHQVTFEGGDFKQVDGSVEPDAYQANQKTLSELPDCVRVPEIEQAYF